MSTICGLIDKWDNLQLEDKIDMLEEISKSFLEEFALDDGVLQYDSYKQNENLEHRNDYAYFDPATNTVYFNEYELENGDAQESINTSYHETMHYINSILGINDSEGDFDNREGNSFQGYYDENDELQLAPPGEYVMANAHKEVDKIAEQEAEDMMNECEAESPGTDEGYDLTGEDFNIEMGEPTITPGGMAEDEFDFTKYPPEVLEEMLGQ